MHTALALAAVASAIAAAGAWAAPPLGAPQVPAARCLIAVGALSWGVAAAAPEPYHLYGTLGGLALGVLGWLALGTAERRPGVRAAPVAIGMLVVGVALGAARHFEQPELALAGGAGWLLVALAAWPADGARASAAGFPAEAPATHTPPAYDSLTGLPGTELLRRRVAHALRERGDAAPPVALLALEIGCDRVEPPELRGDLLEAAAARLAGLLRAGDTAAHLEGQRFGVLAPGLDADALPELAERLLGALARPYSLDGRQFEPGVRAGAALGGASAEDLLYEAGCALACAATGRLAVFEPAMEDAAATSAELAAGLGDALRRGELTLVYQPVFDLVNGRIRSVEALLRWPHPVHGPVAARDVLALAEAEGMLEELGGWALAAACVQWRRWQDMRVALPALGLSVNMRDAQLRDPDLPGRLSAGLAGAAMPGACLTLEIGDGLMASEPETAGAVLAGLAGLGVKVALDAYGAGSAPLGHLTDYRLDAVKLDRALVASLAPDSRATARAAAIVGAARRLGMATTATGLETPAQLAQLKAIGCELGQGHLLAGPMDADGAALLLAHGPRAVA